MFWRPRGGKETPGQKEKCPQWTLSRMFASLSLSGSADGISIPQNRVTFTDILLTFCDIEVTLQLQCINAAMVQAVDLPHTDVHFFGNLLPLQKAEIAQVKDFIITWTV